MRFCFNSILFLCCALQIARAQENYQTRLFTEDDSLAQNYVNAIIQDKQGFLWCSTGKGLSRYDGKDIVNFRKQNGLADGFVTASAIDSSGQLYFGHLNGKLSVYNGRKFSTLETGSASKIVAITPDSKTNFLWAINQAGMLLVINQGMIKKVESELTKDKVINCLTADEGRILIGTSEGIIEVFSDGQSISKEAMVESFEYVNITSLTGSRAGFTWVCTEDAGIFKLRGSESSTFVVPVTIVSPVSLLEDSQHMLWVATKLDGLIKIEMDNANDLVLDVEHLKGSQDQKSPSVLFEDREGDIWSGSLGEGLRQYIPNQFTFFDVALAAGAGEVRSAIEIDKNDYWVGTDKGVIVAHYDEVTKIFHWEKHPDKILASLDVHRLFRNEMDSLVWVGAADQQVFVVDLNSMAVKKINSLESGNLNYAERDETGNTWLALEGNGVQMLDANFQLVKTYNTSNGLLHNSISTICVDRAKNIWFGSLATGLFRLMPDGTFEYWTKDGLFHSYSINDIKEDHDGQIWVATDGDGIAKITSDSIFVFNEDEGILSSFAKQLYVDRNNRIWSTHRAGLSVLNQANNNAIRVFGKREGLKSLINENATMMEDKVGNIWFAQGSNLVRYNIRLESPNYLRRQAVFTNLRLYYKDIDLEAYQSSEGGNLSVNFPHNQNHLTFDFVSISLRERNSIYYKHKLQGYETEWSPATQSASTTYTNLSPGRYTVEVIASDNPYSWNGKPTLFHFNIEKPYWQRWWFYISEAIVLTSLFALTFAITRRISNTEGNRLLRMLVFVLVFIVLEYILVMVEPLMEGFQNGAPVVQVLINLVLALLLLPLEDILTKIFYRKNRANPNG